MEYSSDSGRTREAGGSRMVPSNSLLVSRTNAAADETILQSQENGSSAAAAVLQAAVL
jgi:hypothetical protein